MRSHASSAHSNDEQVSKEEVLSLAMLLEASLFSQQLPDPGHSVSGLFKPIKEVPLSEEQIKTLIDSIKSFNQQDLRTVFGFLLDMLCEGEEPSLSNSMPLLVESWNHINEEVKKIVGYRYHTYVVNPVADTSFDHGAKIRLLEFLIHVNGIYFVPDGTRAKVYRKLANDLHEAKNTSYGWGRSSAHQYLEEFILTLNTERLREILKLFHINDRVREELYFRKPKAHATSLLNKIKEKFTIEAYKSEVDDCIRMIEEL